MQATADGGTPGVDTLSETQYGTNPVGDLNDGSNFFDVAASSGNAFSDVIIQDCNNVTESSVLRWWDPTANSGAGGWSSVVGNPGPTYDPVARCLAATLDATTIPTISQLTGTVFATAIPVPAITWLMVRRHIPGHRSRSRSRPQEALRHHSSNRVCSLRAFTSRTISDGTATLSGTPSGVTVGGVYDPTFTATFGSGGGQTVVSQSLTLFVFSAPKFSSPSTTSVDVAKPLNFVATAPGYPPSAITKTGSLQGVTFQTEHNGDCPSVRNSGSWDCWQIQRDVVGSEQRRNNDPRTIQANRRRILCFDHHAPTGQRGSVYKATLTTVGGVKPLTWKALTSPPRASS